MPRAVVVEKIVHLRAAAGVEQIVFAHIVRNDAEHGAVQVCIDGVADAQAQRVVAVDGHARGEELAHIPGELRKEVGHLTPLHVHDGDCLAGNRADTFARAGGDDVFFSHGNLLLSFRHGQAADILLSVDGCGDDLAFARAYGGDEAVFHGGDAFVAARPGDGEVIRPLGDDGGGELQRLAGAQRCLAGRYLHEDGSTG